MALATEAVADGDRARRATAPANETERRQLARARKFLAEASLHDWVAGLNTTQGIAPVSGVVLRELERRRSEEGAEALVQANSRRGQLQWLRRWRGRWRVSLARLQPGDRLPPEECARKAASLIHPGAERWRAFQQAPGRGALAEPPKAAGQPGVGRAVAGGAKQGVTMRAKKVPPFLARSHEREPDSGPTFSSSGDSPLLVRPSRFGDGPTSCTPRSRRPGGRCASTWTRPPSAISKTRDEECSPRRASDS